MLDMETIRFLSIISLVILGSSLLVPSYTGLPAEGEKNVYVTLILHYDSYFDEEPLDTLEKALEFLKSIDFPMDKLAITVWRDVLERDHKFYRFKDLLESYGFPFDREHIGIFLPPEDANDRFIVTLAMEDYRSRFGQYPLFASGFAASNDTYFWLQMFGVKVTFFNAWEDGQDYSYRGLSCPDEMKGANWEGSPFQPYKPSIRSANAPGLHPGDELDIWECLWVFRNPSYAYLRSNYAAWGSIH
ncbi:MAG: hypothetical protein DRO05_05225, partial [Thermoproteota archaeon]